MREQLPNRRPTSTQKIEHKGQSFFVSVSYDDEGNVREVFGNSSKLTSDMDFLISDACIVLSLALQYSIHPRELKHSLKTIPAFVARDGEMAEEEMPASLIGVLVDILIEEQSLVHRE